MMSIDRRSSSFSLVPAVSTLSLERERQRVAPLRGLWRLSGLSPLLLSARAEGAWSCRLGNCVWNYMRLAQVRTACACSCVLSFPFLQLCGTACCCSLQFIVPLFGER